MCSRCVPTKAEPFVLASVGVVHLRISACPLRQCHWFIQIMEDSECHTQNHGLNFVGGLGKIFLSREVTCLSLCHVDLFRNGGKDEVEWGEVGDKQGYLLSVVETRDGRSCARGEMENAKGWRCERRQI